MAGIKISDLPAAPSATLTDVFPADQGVTTYKETLQQVLTLFQANGSALTKIDDTNVTMTLGGSSSTALLNPASMTLGWTGQLSVSRGGTGNNTFTPYSVICAGTTATGSFQNVVGLGTAGQQLTSNGPGALPTWQDSGAVTPAALTRVNDTNVTLTLGGTPATALLQATSLTVGWSGQLGTTRGGTGLSSYTLGDIIYASATNTLLQLAGNTTSTKQYLSQTGTGSSSAAPVWSTISGSDITGAALTKSDDTNVTLSLGGSPTTSLLRATSLTLGWTGTLSGTRGGTGVNNGSSTFTMGGNVAFSGAFTFTGTVTGNTSVTFPTSGTLATTSQIPTGAALTKTDDTNVTLTLGGSPTTALVNAASLTLGWTGQLGLTRGGTNASLTADNGAIVYSTSSALALLASTATANKMLLSGASGAPSWSTSTIPSSAGATANKILLSDGTNYVLSTPTFPNASATTGKIIISDGTNWIASTPTYPSAAGSSGNVLTSNGTNWVSSPPATSGTVTSVATSGLATGGTITNTGTITVTAAVQSDQEAASSNSVAVTPAVQQFHPSASKCWINFNGTGTIAISASYNVTSITDNGVGDWTVTIATDFSSAFYCVSLGSNMASGLVGITIIGSIAAGSVQILNYSATNSSTTSKLARDDSVICASMFGDQ